MAKRNGRVRPAWAIPKPLINVAQHFSLQRSAPLPVLAGQTRLFRADKFIGRVDAIWNLYDSLFRDSTTVLHGMGVVAGTGGLGKTQLAIEYAHRFGSAYPGGVYWV